MPQAPFSAEHVVFPGYDAMLNDNYYDLVPMITETVMDPVYDLAAADSMSRHAPLDDLNMAQMMSNGLAVEDYDCVMAGDYALDYTCSGMNSTLGANTWSGRIQLPLTPPTSPDRLEELSIRPGRHAADTTETFGCEPLGKSKVQPYRLDTTYRPHE